MGSRIARHDPHNGYLETTAGGPRSPTHAPADGSATYRSCEVRRPYGRNVTVESTAAQAGPYSAKDSQTILQSSFVDLGALYSPLANTGLSIVPPTWNGNDSLPSFSVPPAIRANRFVTNPCFEMISATPL